MTPVVKEEPASASNGTAQDHTLIEIGNPEAQPFGSRSAVQRASPLRSIRDPKQVVAGGGPARVAK